MFEQISTFRNEDASTTKYEGLSTLNKSAGPEEEGLGDANSLLMGVAPADTCVADSLTFFSRGEENINTIEKNMYRCDKHPRMGLYLLYRKSFQSTF